MISEIQTGAVSVKEKPETEWHEMEVETFTDTEKNVAPKDDSREFEVEKQLHVIHIYKNFKISINKPLIPLRIALFLWYGAAKIPISYLTVFLKQKGLSLVEYSSIFSVTFVFQFLTAFLSGILADKIGSAKPVLMFHILVTMMTILSFLFTPRISTCDFSSGNSTHTYGANNISNITGKYEDINETLLHGFVTVVIDTDSEYLSNKSFNTYLSPNNTHIICGKHNENCTFPNLKIENKCTPRQGNFLIVYIVLTITFLSSWSAVYRFMDITVMSLVQKYGTTFGYERFFSISGDVFITFVTGIVLNTFTLTGDENNYQSVYWFSSGMLCFVLVAVYSIKAHIKAPSQNMRKKGFSLLGNIEVVIFIIVIFMLGTYSCFMDNFTLWFLEYLKAKTVILGLQQTLNALYGLPFFITSKWWLRIFGTEKLFILGFLGYIVYGISYSFLHNPWCSLLIESSSAFTYHLLWVAVIVHSHQIAPEELVSTVIATAGAIHFGIGRSSGTVTGGLVMNAVGPRVTFRIFAGMSFVSAIFYTLFLYCRQSKGKRSSTCCKSYRTSSWSWAT